jgi:hypothetical protein
MIPVYPPIYSPTDPGPAGTIPPALKASLEMPDLCLLITATDRKPRVLGRLTGHELRSAFEGGEAVVARTRSLTGHELSHGELVPRAYPPPHKYVFMAKI